MKDPFCHYDELLGTIAVRYADNHGDAWFAADQYLCSITDDEDTEVRVLVDPHSVTDPNSDGEYVFRVRKITSVPDDEPYYSDDEAVHERGRR